MPDYRFYVIRNGGSREPGRDFICLDNKTAAVLADSMLLDNDAVEVWLGPRFVGVVSAAALEQEIALR